MAKAFFGTDGGHDFGFRIEFHVKFITVLLGRFTAQAGDAIGAAVAVIARIQSCFGELFHHDFGRRVGGIAHTQVDDINSGNALVVLGLVDAGEEVRGKALNALGYFNLKGLNFAHNNFRFSMARRLSRQLSLARVIILQATTRGSGPAYQSRTSSPAAGFPPPSAPLSRPEWW